MFGTFRFLLAICVVLQHLLTIPFIGHFAVHGFFILSGYLMTHVMAKTYGYTMMGFCSFMFNRLLRLYPIYWVILLFSVFIVLYFGESNSRMYREFIYLPESISAWFQNIFLIYVNLFPGMESPRLSPPTWALTVELVFYFFIALGFLKSPRASLIWLVISIIYMMATHILNLEYKYRYNFIFAGALPFSIGACLFHFRTNLLAYLESFRSDNSELFLYAAFFANFLLIVLFKFIGWEFGFYLSFYLNYAVCALLVLLLSKTESIILPKRIDTLLGDFSYPMYLMHWQVGFIISMILFSEPNRGLNFEGIIVFSLSVILCMIISYILVLVVDRNVEQLRCIVKKSFK